MPARISGQRRRSRGQECVASSLNSPFSIRFPTSRKSSTEFIDCAGLYHLAMFAVKQDGWVRCNRALSSPACAPLPTRTRAASRDGSRRRRAAPVFPAGRRHAERVLPRRSRRCARRAAAGAGTPRRRRLPRGQQRRSGLVRRRGRTPRMETRRCDRGRVARSGGRDLAWSQRGAARLGRCRQGPRRGHGQHPRDPRGR